MLPLCRSKGDNGVSHECAFQPPQSQVPPGLDDEGLGYVDATGLLSVAVQRLDHAISVIYVAGEVDMVTGPSLEDQLRKNPRYPTGTADRRSQPGVVHGLNGASRAHQHKTHG